MKKQFKKKLQASQELIRLLDEKAKEGLTEEELLAVRKYEMNKLEIFIGTSIITGLIMKFLEVEVNETKTQG